MRVLFPGIEDHPVLKEMEVGAPASRPASRGRRHTLPARPPGCGAGRMTSAAGSPQGSPVLLGSGPRQIQDWARQRAPCPGWPGWLWKAGRRGPRSTGGGRASSQHTALMPACSALPWGLPPRGLLAACSPAMLGGSWRLCSWPSTPGCCPVEAPHRTPPAVICPTVSHLRLCVFCPVPVVCLDQEPGVPGDLWAQPGRKPAVTSLGALEPAVPALQPFSHLRAV